MSNGCDHSKTTEMRFAEKNYVWLQRVCVTCKLVLMQHRATNGRTDFFWRLKRRPAVP